MRKSAKEKSTGESTEESTEESTGEDIGEARSTTGGLAFQHDRHKHIRAQEGGTGHAVGGHTPPLNKTLVPEIKKETLWICSASSTAAAAVA